MPKTWKTSVSAVLKNRSDREGVLAAVSNHVCALAAASKKLKNDREIVLAAVRTSCYALMYASEELKNDLEVVLVAVTQDRTALSFASKELREDAFLKDWASLSVKGKRNRRASEAFLRKHSERTAKLRAQVDLWLIRHGKVDEISAKRRRVCYV